MTFHLQIVTPESVIFQGEVEELIVPTVDGQLAILPNHTQLLSKLAHGELVIKNGKNEQFLAVEGGFIEVDSKQVSVLADYAKRSEDIEIESAKEAKKRAEDLMEKKISAEDFAEAQAMLRRSLLEIKIAGQRKHRSHPVQES